MKHPLCRQCAFKLGHALGGLGLNDADLLRVTAQATGTIDSFVDTGNPPIPPGECPTCFLKTRCTCGKGPECHYNNWPAVVAAAAHNVLFGGARA